MDKDLSLAQMQRVLNAYQLMSVAQSFLDGIKDIADPITQKRDFQEALKRGNISQEALDIRLQVYRDQHSGADMPEELQHGNSALTAGEAAEIANNYIILDHRPNDSNSGFSGTLLKDRNTGEIVWVLRDTEFTPKEFGGNADQDKNGADEAHMLYNGAAYGQIESAKRMLEDAIDNGDIPAGTKINVVAVEPKGPGSD